MQRCVPTWRPAGEDSHRRRPTPAHGDRGLSSEGDLPLREAAQGQPPPSRGDRFTWHKAPQSSWACPVVTTIPGHRRGGEDETAELGVVA